MLHSQTSKPRTYGYKFTQGQGAAPGGFELCCLLLSPFGLCTFVLVFLRVWGAAEDTAEL